MHRRASFWTVAALAAAVALPSAASAQIGLGIGGGPSIPLGHAADHADMGFHVLASVGLGMLPIELRADLMLQEFIDDDDENARAVGGMLNAFLQLPAGGINPYATAGLGLMNVRDPDHADDETEFAFAVGGGLRFGLLGQAAFIEARYFAAGEDHQGIPITLGITFFTGR